MDWKLVGRMYFWLKLELSDRAGRLQERVLIRFATCPVLVRWDQQKTGILFSYRRTALRGKVPPKSGDHAVS